MDQSLPSYESRWKVVASSECELTCALVSGPTLHHSNHSTYALPKVPSCSPSRYLISTLAVVILGRSTSSLLPSCVSNMRSRSEGRRDSPDVSESVAIMSPRAGLTMEARAEPTERKCFCQAWRGMCDE